MDELKKERSVIEKHASDITLESLLVVNASIGQNGLQQAKSLHRVLPAHRRHPHQTGRQRQSGIVFSIARELNLPVKLIGLGEKIDDLRDFEPKLFVEALFD